MTVATIFYSAHILSTQITGNQPLVSLTVRHNFVNFKLQILFVFSTSKQKKSRSIYTVDCPFLTKSKTKKKKKKKRNLQGTNKYNSVLYNVFKKLRHSTDLYLGWTFKLSTHLAHRLALAPTLLAPAVAEKRPGSLLGVKDISQGQKTAVRTSHHSFRW